MNFINRLTHKILRLATTVMLSSVVVTAQAGPLDDAILSLQQQWAHINYELEGDEQEKAFELLVVEAEKVTEAYPEAAEAWVWSGIIKSSFGGAKGGLGALSLVKAAKKDLEKALALDRNALGGSAYASLGVLYHKVPGWPIGFGSDNKAEKLLKKALEINPDGKEPNFFYGEYLYDERKYQDAKRYLLAAQQAPARENRPLAYKFRQVEIAAMLEKVEKKLAKIAKRKNRNR